MRARLIFSEGAVLPGSSSGLALRTVMSRSLTDDDPQDFRVAAAAFFLPAAINIQIFLVISSFPIRVEVALNAGPAIMDSAAQHSRDCFKKSLLLAHGQRTDRPFWMNSGFKEGFIGINIAYSRDKTLIQQQRFNS